MKTNTPRTDYIVSKCQPPIDAETAFATMNDHAEYLEVKLTAVTEQRDQWKDKYIQQNKDLGHELRDPNGTIWSECKRLQTELDVVTEQRNVAAEALRKLADCDWVITPRDRMDAVRTIAREALQSLTKKEQ